jgi:hypothetical protein
MLALLHRIKVDRSTKDTKSREERRNWDIAYEIDGGGIKGIPLARIPRGFFAGFNHSGNLFHIG